MPFDSNDSTLGLVAAAADGHVGNPVFYAHCNRVLLRVRTASNMNEVNAASEELLLFTYMSILDLYRKFLYIHAATREFFKASFSQLEENLLERIAEEHKAIEDAKREEEDEDVPHPRLVIQVLERQVHQLWAEYEPSWRRSLEAITGVDLTGPTDPTTIDEAHHERGTIFGPAQP